MNTAITLCAPDAWGVRYAGWSAHTEGPQWPARLAEGATADWDWNACTEGVRDDVREAVTRAWARLLADGGDLAPYRAEVAVALGMHPVGGFVEPRDEDVI